MDYAEFLEKKKISDKPTGLKVVPELNPMLFDFQRDIVKWALKRGRAAIWADCGLGKGPMALEWAKHVPGRVLIVAPLAVSHQFKRESEKFGVEVCVAKTPDQAEGRIIITNYERVELFDASEFTGVVLDESSILKAHDGKTRSMMIEKFKQTPFRLCCTATPAPNDHMELGNHAEFLGTMSRVEMLSMFFVHDGGDTAKWRLKGHAKSEFWKWLASWAVMIRKPSDLGYSDDGFDLPDLHMHQHTVEVDKPTEGMLFAMEAQTLQDRLQARRASIDDRVTAAAHIVNNTDGQFLVWCNFNDESAMLAKLIDGAVEVKGSDSSCYKETAANWFLGYVCDCQLQKSRKNVNTQAYKKTLMLGGEQWEKNHEPSTCESGSEATEQKSENTGKKQRKRGTSEGENCTGTSQKEGHALLPQLQNGEQKTQKDTSRNESKNMGLPQTNTDQCLQPNLEDALFVESCKSDSILTTATKQGKSEDCFVQNATSVSGNSKTTTNLQNEHICTCGGIKPNRVMISKPSIFGFGLNFQNCQNMAFVGLSDSYEQFYQAVRRCWRFGQKKPVHVHMITAQTEGAVVANIKRKEKDAMEMAESMVEHMKEINTASIHGATVREKSPYVRDMEKGAGWTAHLGDCVDVASEMKDDSLHYTVYSPPFASLYTYSNSDRDMGNCTDYDVFFEQYKFLVKEIYRATMPGRLVSFHCMNLPTSKERHGFIGIQDFRGDLIRIHQDAGFIFHSEVCIWKDPVTAMQRTKALGLLHKQIRKDSCMSRQGIPDYLVTMRKPGENPEKVSHTHDDFPVSLWQRYASPVWMDINPSDTLQYRSAREHNDERHICPLQLEVIRRALKLWSNPGDLVFSPFMGIGSEGYVAIQECRKFVGSELKRSYYEQACRNLAAAEKEQFTLFSE